MAVFGPSQWHNKDRSRGVDRRWLGVHLSTEHPGEPAAEQQPGYGAVGGQVLGRVQCVEVTFRLWHGDLMNFFNHGAVVLWAILRTSNSLDTWGRSKHAILGQTTEVTHSKHRAVVFACGFVQLDAKPISWSELCFPIETHNTEFLSRHQHVVP